MLVATAPGTGLRGADGDALAGLGVTGCPVRARGAQSPAGSGAKTGIIDEAQARITRPIGTAAIRAVGGIALAAPIVAEATQGGALDAGRAPSTARVAILARKALAAAVAAPGAACPARGTAPSGGVADIRAVLLRDTAAVGAGRGGTDRAFALPGGGIAGAA
jgi:hypothetical protein